MTTFSPSHFGISNSQITELQGAQTSDQAPPLNMGIFVTHKMESRRVHLHLVLKDQTLELVKMLCGFQKHNPNKRNWRHQKGLNHHSMGRETQGTWVLH
jgi:hypothetical protein